MQQEHVFFGPGMGPSAEERLWLVNFQENPECPLHSFVGNEDARSMLSTLAYDALGRHNHLCREMALAILGPAGTGKTTLVRRFAKLLSLPLVEISPKSVSSLEDFVNEIADVLEKEELPLTPVKGDSYYVLPPMVIFIDEVHALSDSIVQGLLKATEYADSMLSTDRGRDVNTYNVQWIIATTDSGKLFDAFRSRFATVELYPLGKEDLAKVILLNNPDWPLEAGQLVAHYVPRNTREALQFARYMRLVKNMKNRTWEDAAHEVARQYGIDEHGMHKDEMAILSALSNRSIPKGRIMTAVPGKKVEEIERYILPPLMQFRPGQPPLVQMTSKGYSLTKAGRELFESRS